MANPKLTFSPILKLLLLLLVTLQLINLSNTATANTTPPSKSNFTCDNGKLILPIEKQNDDYCDCLDGTDENRI